MKKIEASELALLDPSVRRDKDRVAAFLDDEFIEFGASGRVYTKPEILAFLSEERSLQPTVADMKTTFIAPDIALVTYRILGKRESLRSSLWRKRDGQWRMVFHQGTLVPVNPPT